MTVVVAYTEPCPVMIACEVMFVELRAGGSQGSSVWLVQLVLHSLCSTEQTLFHPFSLVGCQGCCKLSFPSFPLIAQLMQMPESNIVIFSRFILPLLETF